MRLVLYISFLVCAISFVGGCDANKGTQKPTGVIPESQLNALDKANHVDNILKDSNQNRLDSVD